VALPGKRISKHELDICARVRTVRESIHWPQSAFASELQITRDQLASIECGRTPLRYEIAWKIGQSFGINLRWLESGLAFAGDKRENNTLPTPTNTGLPIRALLSEVIRKSLPKMEITLSPACDEQTNMHLVNTINSDDKGEIRERLSFEYFLLEQIKIWIEEIPTNRLGNFADEIVKLANTYLSDAPELSLGRLTELRNKLMWERLKYQNTSHSLLINKALTIGLTNIDLSGNIQIVKPILPSLLKRLRDATQQRGKRSELARFLGVSLEQVSRWLNGDKEPGGETTLRLQLWVEREERLTSK
jgi:transcriptional regulator with XRE-family HTH domain